MSLYNYVHECSFGYQYTPHIYLNKCHISWCHSEYIKWLSENNC